MKNKITGIVSLVLSLILVFQVLAFAGEGSPKYSIVSPYDDVIWSGKNAWGAYKGNLHTHSFVSDGNVDYRDMILEYYRQGFDFLAMTDHMVTGKEWNKIPTKVPLYLYQDIIGNSYHRLSDEEYSAVLNGTYPIDGKARGYGMTCVTGGNELNGLTITKDHVNAVFLPEYAGNNYMGFENDYEGAVRLADHYGALSFINHPGDWIDSNSDRANCSNPEYISYYGDILLRYDSCLGMEVFNSHNGKTGYDRDTWDNLLMYCLPYGKTVIGFANGDTHKLNDVDSSFSVYMMEKNDTENIRKTMQSGSSFMVTRCIRKDTEKFGPDEDLDVRNKFELAYPMFSDIKVSGHIITISFSNAYDVKWIADGNVIAGKTFTQTDKPMSYSINLDEIKGSEDFLYVRCQLIGDGGITLTQAFVIDDGSKPLTYKKDNSAKAVFSGILRQILSLRLFVIIKELWNKAVK